MKRLKRRRRYLRQGRRQKGVSHYRYHRGRQDHRISRLRMDFIILALEGLASLLELAKAVLMLLHG
jgi:hypothetical protein